MKSAAHGPRGRAELLAVVLPNLYSDGCWEDRELISIYILFKSVQLLRIKSANDASLND